MNSESNIDPNRRPLRLRFDVSLSAVEAFARNLATMNSDAMEASGDARELHQAVAALQWMVKEDGAQSFLSMEELAFAIRLASFKMALKAGIEMPSFKGMAMARVSQAFGVRDAHAEIFFDCHHRLVYQDEWVGP